MGVFFIEKFVNVYKKNKKKFDKSYNDAIEIIFEMNFIIFFGGYMSRFISFLIIFILLGFWLNSCVTPDETMKSYLGRQISEVIMNEGPASDVQPDGQGGKVYTWYYRRQGYTASRTFLCDGNGKIYAYRWQGL